MRPAAAPIGMRIASPDVLLAAAVAIVAAVFVALPLVEMLPCMRVWLHGVAACLP